MKPAVPTATYRVQLNREFGFNDCALVLPYLSALGISTLYCSPVLQAVPGSTHGYDTIDPTRLSTDLGGEDGWSRRLGAARDCRMTLLLDIVPNHMSATPANPWWRDVLEYGRFSPYASYFDIDWQPPESRLKNRVMLPVLSVPLRDVIAAGHMSVHLTPSGLVLRHGELELPLDLRSYRHVLTPLITMSAGALPTEFIRLVRAIAALQSEGKPPGNEAASVYDLRTGIKRKLMDLILPQQASSEPAEDDIAALVRSAAARLSPDGLRRMLQEQHYVLDYWKTGRHHINYRRFFEINDLVGIRVEDEQVFEATHSALRALAVSESIIGFRVDHVDGLRLPRRYLAKLRSSGAAGPRNSSASTPYVVVEKILSGDEVLPHDWPVDGTTGYDFLNEAGGLFIDRSGLSAMQRYCWTATRTQATRGRLAYDNQRRVLRQSFRPELSRLARLLLPVARWQYPGSDVSVRELSSALVDVTAALPVYRTYYEGRGKLTGMDRRHIEAALERVRWRAPSGGDSAAREVVRCALTLDLPENAPFGVKQSAREHLLRWQQLTGAAMAKGFEDTTLYQDAALLALNTVGGRESPSATTLEHFHAWNEDRLETWPHTMNCTATHDTKRGEDVRARLSVLSEMPDAWAAATDRWFASLAGCVAIAPVLERVNRVAHLFLLQTMLGAWPEDDDLPAFADRLADYMIKVAREAKTHSSWLEPDEEYEMALARLARFALVGEGASLFRQCFDPIISALRFHGLVNSLCQLLLKITCPGVPDFYQGTELLELSLVDPDNRRPVDYAPRQSLLDRLHRDGRNRLRAAEGLAGIWPDARAKMYVMNRALSLRGAHAGLFQKGSYEPLYADGARRNHVCAFVRRHRGIRVVVVVPLRSLTLSGSNRLPLGTAVWETESLALPSGLSSGLENVLSGERVDLSGDRLPLSDVFRTFPVALLLGRGPRRT